MRAVLIMSALVAAAMAGEVSRGDQPIALAGADGSALTTFTKSWALLIGVSQYRHQQKLDGVAEDLPAVQQALESQGFGVVVVRDPESASLDWSVKDFIGRHGTDPSARLVIYYAGHGTVKDGAGYLLTVDTPASVDDPGFIAHAFAIEDLRTRVNQARARHVLVACDACFSGSLFKVRDALPPVVAAATRDPVRVFLTAGSAKETVPDQSVFRRSFVEALTTTRADSDGDGFVLGTELVPYVRKRVLDAAARRGESQTPQFKWLPGSETDPMGDLVFRAGATDPAAQQASLPALPAAPAGRAAIYAAAEKLETTEGADLPARWNAWSAVVRAAPADQNDWSTRDDKIQARAQRILTEITPAMDALTRAKSLATAEALTADENATKRQRIQAWTAVQKYWDVPDEGLSSEERQLVIVLEPRLAAMALPLAGRERIVRERREQLAREQAEREQAERDRVAQIERERQATLAREQAERERLALIERERIERERLAQEQAERNRLASVEQARRDQERQEAQARERERRTQELFKAPWAAKRGEDQYGTWADLKVGSVVQRMRWIKPGNFQMGSDEGAAHERPVHLVTLSGFWLGESEVTQELWEKVMDANPSKNSSSSRPVERISWDDCQGFFTRLNQQVVGLHATFPTEAQWEYACRAGSTEDVVKDLDALAWYDANAGGETHRIKKKKVNAWGLFDMQGNIWELCGDWLGDYLAGAVTDPTGPASGSSRVLRGGGWNGEARGCRAANRNGELPGYRGHDVGLRLAVPVQAGP
ncbi:hypothetical protein LBMAG53_38050 [Planctomycetota bacterium]|nr:hypothetical protein LBMAG53_38050 [Planctomycetota bacterium]